MIARPTTRSPATLTKMSRKLTIAAVAAVSIAAMTGAGRTQDFIAPLQRDPPYETQLLRLSEILGAVHYLRELCDSDEGNLWRDQMLAIITAEEPNPIRRARIVDRFNRGYDSFRSVYRTCTIAATSAIDRYMEEGVKITRDITARYGEDG